MITERMLRAGHLAGVRAGNRPLWHDLDHAISLRLKQDYLPAALSAARLVWEPMETAPKDRTSVLLWWPYWRSKRPVIGYFDGVWHAEEATSDQGDGPAAWMPLPPLPKHDKELVPDSSEVGED